MTLPPCNTHCMTKTRTAPLTGTAAAVLINDTALDLIAPLEDLATLAAALGEGGRHAEARRVIAYGDIYLATEAPGVTRRARKEALIASLRSLAAACNAGSVA